MIETLLVLIILMSPTSGLFIKKLTKQFQDRLADASTTAEECISRFVLNSWLFIYIYHYQLMPICLILTIVRFGVFCLFASIRTVRSFVGEPKASNTYGEDIDKSYKVGKKLAIVQGKILNFNIIWDM